MKQQLQTQQMQMSQGGPTLSLTMGGMRGFVNVLVLVGLAAGFSVIVFLITLNFAR